MFAAEQGYVPTESPSPARRIRVLEDAAPDAEVGSTPLNADRSPQHPPEPPHLSGRRTQPEPATVPEKPDDSAPGAQNEVAAGKSEQDRWREARIDLEAAKERAVRETERAKQEARADLVAKLFPVLDNLDRSLASDSRESALREGVEVVRSQFAQVLAEFGVERINSVGQPFDPRQHEAVDVVTVDCPSEHNRVKEEWQAGYRYAGRVLRPAKVRVGRARGA